MIILEPNDKKWIKICKGHYKDKYPYKGRWVDTLKPLFTELYGWNPDEDKNYHDYLNCVFNRLLDLYFKIADNQFTDNRELKNVFSAAFYPSVSRMDSLPIERAISELCAMIQFNTVRTENGEQRYEL